MLHSKISKLINVSLIHFEITELNIGILNITKFQKKTFFTILKMYLIVFKLLTKFLCYKQKLN